MLPTFAHGIHPPTHKDETCGRAIHQFPFSPLMEIPLAQHTGKPARAIVREGESVIRGQCIAEPDGFMSTAMHAPVSFAGLPWVILEKVPSPTLR